MGVYADGGLKNVVFLLCLLFFFIPSGFSASVPPMFTPKGALGGDFGPKHNFGKS